MKLPHTQPRQFYGYGVAPTPRPSDSINALTSSLDLPFVELLGRSNFSFLEGASHPEEMILQAQRLGYKGFGLCDVNGLYGVVRAFQAVEYPSKFLLQEIPDFKLSFHVGTELLVHSAEDSGDPERPCSFSICLLPINKYGYYEICKLITLSKRRSPKGFASLSVEDLRTHAQELMAFPLPPWREKDLHALGEIFGGHLYLPVAKDYTWESLETYKQALTLEEKYGIPIVASNRPLMHARERKPLLDVLTCVQHKTTLEKAKTRLTQNAERYLKPLAELKELWSDRPDCLTRTLEISRELKFTLHEVQYEYPKAVSSTEEPSEVLKRVVERGLKKRFPEGWGENIQASVDHELALIKDLKYEDYFLTLWDVCQFADSVGILHQGRGSAANSVVCYALELTAVNPATTKAALLFERFLSKERGEPPDIDIDFESDRREEVIQYIYKKYGSEHAAMVCNVVCYRSRMALRECAKTFGIPLTKINRLIKYSGREGLSRLKEQDPTDMAEYLDLPVKTYSLWLQTASALVGFPRHLGIHSGGFLISHRPIFECVPVEKATMDQRYVIQWNKDDLTVLKMLKIDVLGLGMLGALRRCFELLRSHRGRPMDLYNVPHDDQKTYAMIQKADTVGVFQIESRAQMSLLPRLKPKEFYDLVIEVAIVRPGPLQGGMVHPFIRRRHGLEKVHYAHPDLEPVLKRTHGVPIFQEQIMQIATAVCGFSPGESDELRRIMSSSWKKHDLMEGLKQRIINGMLAHGVELEYAERIYQTIVGFASYGFPESHAASFALITYASCYIKCHHPDVFVCSLLNSQPMGFYSPRALIADAKKHGVKFMDVDLQNSEFDYTLVKSMDRTVRVGFCSLYGLKREEIERVIEERKRGGSFLSLEDFVRRCPFVRKRSLLLLAAAGALRGFGLSPREALWKVQSVNLNPASLFFTHSNNGPDDFVSDDFGKDQKLIPAEDDEDLIQREYKAQGFSLHKHPLDLYRKELRRGPHRFHTAEDLEKLPGGRTIWIAGLMALHQRPPTAKGFSFLTMEDESGSFNVVLTPQVYEKFRLDLIFYPMLKIRGTLEKKGGVINVRATELARL